MNNKQKVHWFDKALKEDYKYFEIQVNKGIKRLAGSKTKESLRDCCHCRLWRKADRFIKEIRGI